MLAAVAQLAMPSRGEVIAGKYRIDGLLGEGGMGVVYAAVHLVTGKRVAIKWLPAEKRSEERRQRLLLEAQAAGRIDHPNVVDVYDFGEHEGSVFLVMEHLQGVPLTAAMEAGPMTPRDAIALLMPVLRGVGAAHARGIVHRDLKPDNVFLCEDQSGAATTVKVLDFGISKMAGPNAMSLTATGIVLGTPLYCSPEQLRGKKDVDGRADLYALGCMLYEMLEGEPPFLADSYADLAALKLMEAPRPFQQPVPQGLREVILRAMHVDRDQRFLHVLEFGEALEPFAGGLKFRDTDTDWSGVFPARSDTAPTVVRPPAITQAAPRARRRAWLLGGVGLGVVALAAALTLLVLEPEPNEPVVTPLARTVDSTPPELPPENSAEAARSEATAVASAEPMPEPEPAVQEPTRVQEPTLQEPTEVEQEPEDTATEPARTMRRRRGMRRAPRSNQHRTGGLSLRDFR